MQCGDMVVYGIHGVCRIVDTESRTVDKRQVEYFVLQPCDQLDARFYIPTQNPAALAKLRKILSREEVDALLDSKEVKDGLWIADEAARKDKYRKILANADCAELIGMIRVLYFHKQQQLAAGRKFHQCDESFMKDAERLIRSELSCVLGIPQAEVGQYIYNKLET